MEEVLNKLIEQDKDFAIAKFKSKVENEFIQIMLSMVTRKTERIRHFVNEEVYEKILNKVNDDASNDRIQMYDELNVAGVEIVSIEEKEDSFVIYVSVASKALDYYLSASTRKYLSGNNTSRTDRTTRMTFTKKKNNLELGAARRCPACGANLDVNRTGVCSYCGTTLKLENYDWVITGMSI